MSRISELRKAKGETMTETAKNLNMPYTTYVNYEKGTREPNTETLVLLANYFKVTVDYLIGNAAADISSYENIIPFPKMTKVPVLGSIACGEPILAEENIESYVNMPKEIRGTFALRCKGDSMINARIFDGDIVFIRQQPDVENGEIAAVLIGDEATLKRVYKYTNRLELRAENPTFPTLNFEGDDLQKVRIIGKAVGFLSTII